MKVNHYTTLLAAAALGLAVQAHGATIASFEFTGGSAASSDTETLTTASNVTFSSALSGGAFANDELEVQGSDTANNNSLGGTNNEKIDTAIDNDYYFSFTIDIDAGYELNLTELTDQLVMESPYEFYGGVYNNGTGFTNGDALDEIVNTDNDTRVDTYNQTVVLSSQTALQGLTGSNEFRFYMSDGSTSTTRIFNFDNITLSGDISVVPEPSAFGLLAGCFALTWVMLRRR